MSFEATLLSRLRQLLAEVDLATTTERQLRTTLEEEFGRGLKEYKQLIRASVTEFLQSQQAEEEEEEDTQHHYSARATTAPQVTITYVWL